MANEFGRAATAQNTGRPGRTQLYCSNCRQNSEWNSIKGYDQTVISGTPSIQTQEVSGGRWAAHCPKCGMPYMAADRPVIIEGVQLMVLEGKSDAEIREFQEKAVKEERGRIEKSNKQLKEQGLKVPQA